VNEDLNVKLVPLQGGAHGTVEVLPYKPGVRYMIYNSMWYHNLSVATTITLHKDEPTGNYASAASNLSLICGGYTNTARTHASTTFQKPIYVDKLWIQQKDASTGYILIHYKEIKVNYIDQRR
jgi:hypothetical protein